MKNKKTGIIALLATTFLTFTCLGGCSAGTTTSSSKTSSSSSVAESTTSDTTPSESGTENPTPSTSDTEETPSISDSEAQNPSSSNSETETPSSSDTEENPSTGESKDDSQSSSSGETEQPAKTKYAVTIISPEGVTVTAKVGDKNIVSGDEIEEDSVITLSYTLEKGYSFNNFTVNDENASDSITLTQNVTISASVTHNEYNITVTSSDGGKITASKTKAYYGETITLSNTPDDYYAFASYSVNGVSQTESSFTMPDGHITITGTFTYAGKFNAVSGSVTENGNSFTSSANNTLAIRKLDSFASGTLSMKINLNGKSTSDNGIVFSVTNPENLASFWEENVSYYFFFISQNGNVFLGKVANGEWITCGYAGANIDYNSTYTLSVSVEKGSSQDIIRCFVNDTMYISYADSNKLSGTEYGIRTGTNDITFSEITTQNTIKGQYENYSDYTVRNGSFTTATNGLKSNSANALATKNNSYFKYGSLSAKVTLGGTTNDCGLVFGLTSNSTSYWEGNGISYYFLFISSTGYVSLGKTDNGNWSNYGWIALSNFSANASYTLKVVKDDATIYCYVNNSLLITFADSSVLTGTGYGVRAGASNVTFSDIVNISSSHLQVTRPTDLTSVSGDFRGVNGSTTAGVANSIATISDMTSGTLSVNVTGVTNGDSGVIFAYSDNNNYYKFYTSRSTQTVKLAKVENGQTTVLYSNYLSAGYYESGAFPFKVVIRENKAHCYFFNTLYTTVNIALSGKKVGLYSANSGTVFTNYSVSSDDTVVTCDTLLFGHSYFELWDDWKDDFAYVQSQVTGFGSYTNIGIGGSQASHWLNFKEALLSYNFKKAVYMIGINDLSAGVSPQMTVNNITELLLYLKQQIPELTVVLVGVNQCNARHTDYATYNGVDVHTEVSATNVLLRKFVAQYDWINFADIENIFCDANGNPVASYFKDGLHPTSGSNHGSSSDAYRDLLIPAIISAWKGENQPTLSEADKADLLTSAKNVKLCSLASYTIDAFRNAEWATAEPIYNEAVAKVNACTTVDEVKALDLSSYITKLSKIKNNAQYTLEEMLNQNATNDGSYFNDYLWQDNNAYAYFNQSSGVTYNVRDYGHILDGNVCYSDLSFTLKMTDNSGTVATAGALFRARQTSGRGIDGYMINLVSDMNYVQIWYFNNAYQASGSTPVLKYLGGWVYPKNVVGTTFRVVVKGTICLVYDEEDYIKYGEDAYGCSADLTSGDKYYSDGYFGVLGWNNNVSLKLEVASLSGSACHSAKTSATTAQTVINGITSGTSSSIFSYGNNSFAEGVANSNGNTVTMQGNGHVLNTSTLHSDVHVTFKLNYPSDIELVGILLRSTLTANNGINGYLLDFHRVESANEFYVRFWKLNDFLNNNNDRSCNYLGGWIAPGEVLNTNIHLSLVGNNVYISADYLGTCGTFTLAGTDNQSVYSSGYFGLMNINDSVSSITVSHLSFSKDVKQEVSQGIVAYDNVYSNADTITDNNGALHTAVGCYSVYNGVLARDFTMEVTVSGVSTTGLPFNEANQTQAGFLFRATKNASSGGINGYFLNFVADDTHQYVQIWYINNGYNYSGDNAQEAYQYIGGWIYPGNVVGTTFTIKVENDTAYISSASQTDVIEVTLSGNSQGLSCNLPVYTHGGFGILTYHSLDLTFNSIILK